MRVKDLETKKVAEKVKKIPKIYWSVQKKLLPNIKSSQNIYEAYLKNIVKPNSIWLDLGCGHRLFHNSQEAWGLDKENKIIKQCKDIYGLDYDFDSLIKHRSIKNRMQGNITKLPLKSGSFDLITSNMVVEHLDNPKEQFKEINRILKDNGLFIFHTPNKFSYGALSSRLIPKSFKKILIKTLDGRKESDIFKTYYRANSQKKVLELAKEAGFVMQGFRFVIDPVAKLARFPLIAFFELLYIKVLTIDLLKKFRTNIICTLKKQTP